MSAKAIVVLCIQALFSHAAFSQCINSGHNPAYGFAGVNHGIGLPGLNAAAASTGGFSVTSSSPIAPKGVSIVSEYVIEGPLSVGGELPVFATVAVDGEVPSDGAAGTSYSCGDGDVAILNEGSNSVSAAKFAAAANSAALGVAGLGRRRAGCRKSIY